jgi:hypothetical protein
LVEVGGCGGKNGAETRQQFCEIIFWAKIAGIFTWFWGRARIC